MEAGYFTILYWFCHTSAWIHHGRTRVPRPEPPFHLPPCTIPLGHPSAPAPSVLYPASNLDWWFIFYMILYMFQCHSPKSSHPLPLPQSPKDYTFMSLLLSRIQGYRYHLSKFHIYALIYCIGVFLSFLSWLDADRLPSFVYFCSYFQYTSRKPELKETRVLQCSSQHCL